MQNTLLVGLSKQMVLERQMDVVSNNIANMNTNGYKADRSLFQEYQSSNAHEDNFASADRRVSFVQDRATKAPFAPEIGLNKKIKKLAFEEGLICYPMGGTIDGRLGDHVLLAPPFIISENEIDELVSKLGLAVDRALAS